MSVTLKFTCSRCKMPPTSTVTISSLSVAAAISCNVRYRWKMIISELEVILKHQPVTDALLSDRQSLLSLAPGRTYEILTKMLSGLCILETRTAESLRRRGCAHKSKVVKYARIRAYKHKFTLADTAKTQRNEGTQPMAESNTDKYEQKPSTQAETDWSVGSILASSACYSAAGCGGVSSDTYGQRGAK